MLSFPVVPIDNVSSTYSTPTLDRPREGATSLASAGGAGNSLTAVQYMSRVINAEQISILNTFADTNTHSGEIGLSSYLNPSWHIYEVTVDVNSMEAAPEREVVGITYETFNYQISEILGTFYSQIAQGFYDQPFDGTLQNYSIYYSTTDYTPATRGNASFIVSSDYTTSSSAMTTLINMTASDSVFSWVTLSGENSQLDADTVYWAVINGSLLNTWGSPIPTYPIIYWGSESTSGVFDSYKKGTTVWDLQTLEGLLNYTYTPWNTTAAAALQFSSPENVSLLADSVPQTGNSWTFTDGVSNITSIQFETNQSIYLDYNITIWYQKSVSSTTNWGVDISGNPIVWNATTDLTYPVFPETSASFLDVTVNSDWTTAGLYNSTDLSTDYSHNSRTGNVVTCTDMTNGTWILSSSAHNYITAVDLSDSSNGIPIGEKVSILVDVDIDITVEDGVGTPMNTDSTNLTIWYGGAVILAPPDEAVSAGLASYLWDISAENHNGTHIIEVYWTSGLEAGYFVVQVFVYYPTTLVTDEMAISAYIENNFTIGVDFDQDFPVRGLDGSLASVEYSFDGGANTSLNDQTGGRWTATVFTTGKTDGSYLLYIYAEGYALENQSLTINVDLTIETQALNWSWSPSNVITYLESTNLTVSYRDSIGTNIPDALVNITFDSATYDLTWDATSELYWIQLNGTDFLTVPGTTVMTLNAWKAGYTSQYNDTIAITVNEESTGIGLIVDWIPLDRNITYIEHITINVTYTYNSVPIDDTWDGVWVRATFSGYPLVNLIYNGSLEQWEVTLNGSDYLGVTTVTIRASATGYNQVQDVQDLLVMEDIPALVNSWTDSSASTDYESDILLQITVRDSSGAFINGATLTANVFDSDFPMIFNGDGVYSILIDPQETRGIHVVNVTIAEYGYVITSMYLNLTVRATTGIDFVNYISSEYEQWNLNITVTYNDTFYNIPIIGATVTVTIDGVEYALTYNNNSEFYTCEILLDFDPGTYTLDIVANAQFCNEELAARPLEILAKDAVYLSLTTEGDPSVEGQLLSIIATLRYNGTDIEVPNMNIHFIVTILYVNGTEEVRDDPLQYDTTNDDGVASWGFEIPSGTIESITVEAMYPGSRDKWATSLQYVVAIGSNPLMLILSFLFFTDIGRLLVATLLVLGIVATAYNKKVKPRKRAARDSLENQLQMFRDLETLRHFMAVYLDRGTCVFYHPFTDERIQPDLISGFIAAITSVYGEIKGDGVRGTLEEIQYQGLRLNSYSGEFLIGILILEGEMTPLLRERLQFFVELFENQYDKELTDWTGLIDCFDPEWVVSNLTSAYNYTWLHAHKFGLTQKVAKTDARILDYISAVRDDRGEFYIKNLISPLAEMLDQTEAQVLDRLLYLQDNGMITPVSIQTILQRQGMGLANGEIGPDNIILEPQDDETSAETEVEPEPAEESPPAKEDLVDDFVKEVESLMTVEPEDKKDEPDSIEDFVKDVESLLTNDKEKEDDE